jgi:Zn-dependent protease with chaperone function
VVVSVAQLKWIGTIVSGEAVLDAFYDIKQGKRSKGSSPRLILGVVAVGLSYSIFGFILANISRYSAYFTSSVSLSLLFVIAVFPSMYFAAGLFYQTFHSVEQKIRLLQNSRRLEVSSISSTVLLDTSDELESPASLSTGVEHYVIIPEKIADALDKNELRAVIAHEQKHIESGEAFLSFVIPVLSILLLTGQNVIYSLLDFRQREFDADQIAADQVGEENMISALQKISKLVDQQTEEPGFWQEYFGMFYGTFALSQAHPSLSERIQSLSE